MSQDEFSSPAETFAVLGLAEPLLRATQQLGFTHPTPVQAQAIPAILRGLDVWASAKTGSGKTAAFVLPMLHMLRARQRIVMHPTPVFALVLSPTRELAMQTAQVVNELSRTMETPPKVCVAVGGVSINPQMMDLRGGADVVVATPGRLLDLVDQNALELSAVKQLVLDEADRLLSLGFTDELARVFELLPEHCQKLLFSATFPPAVRKLVQALLHEPVAINIDAGALPDVSAIKQRVIEVDDTKRGRLLQHLVKTHEWPSVLVFVATQYAAEHVTKKLLRDGFTAAALHGELSQTARTQALEDFKAADLQILVATDLASRGLDIEQLSAVINYDLPRSPADYLHRIGRTGRAGQSGVAVTFINAATSSHMRLIEKRHGLTLPRETIAGFPPTANTPAPANPHGGIKGKRKSKKDKLREAAAKGETSQS